MKNQKDNVNEKKSVIENKSNLEDNSKKKIIPSYAKENKVSNKKHGKHDKNGSSSGKKKIFKSKLSILFILLGILCIAAIGFGVYELVYHLKYKNYFKYEDSMKVYGFDIMYDNSSSKTGQKVTKSEALKMAIVASLNENDITNYIDKPVEDYKNAIWVDYALRAGIINKDEINKANAQDKVTYAEVIRYFSNAKLKILGKTLDTSEHASLKDYEMYTPDEKIAIDDIIYNKLIVENTKKINGKHYVFKGQINEIITNYVNKYSTIALAGEKLNINPEKIPSNAGVYPYTLATVDKSAYEIPFNINDNKTFINPKELYRKNKDLFASMKYISESYFNNILNVDYTTIDKDAMKKEMKKYVLVNDTDENYQKYVDYVKENKIKIEGKATAQIPAIYYDGSVYKVRMKLTFEIKNSNTKENLLFQDLLQRDKIVYENDKYTIYIDVSMSNAIGTNTLYISQNAIYNLLLNKEDSGIMQQKGGN
ncbi:MAG: hypothetical protein RSD14_00315 [Clostridia bacterium]